MLTEAGDVGVVCVGVVYILRTVFEFLNKGSAPKWALRTQEQIRELKVQNNYMQVEVTDLHEWHKPDASGEMSWKNNRMIDCVEKLTDVVDRQTRVMERLMPVLERLETKL